jgi:hypothetical protein
MNVTAPFGASAQRIQIGLEAHYQPHYDNTGQNEERPARLYGNLVCRAGIQPPER